MSQNRKTIPVDMLLDYANGYLASDYSGGDSVDALSRRQGVIDIVEATLHSLGRYRGFSYLDQKAIIKSKPGIYWLDSGGHTFEKTDPTRRRYA